MGTNVQKCYLRRNSVKRWNAGRLRNGLLKPTKEEYAIFITGFNMGYECCKTKHLKDIKIRS